MGPGNFSISLHTEPKAKKCTQYYTPVKKYVLCHEVTEHWVFGGNQYVKSENYEDMFVEISFLLS